MDSEYKSPGAHWTSMPKSLGWPDCANAPSHSWEPPSKWGLSEQQWRGDAWEMHPLEWEERLYAHSIDRHLIIKADKATTIYECSISTPSRPAYITVGSSQHHSQLHVALYLATYIKKGNCISFSFFLLAMPLPELSTTDFLLYPSYSTLLSQTGCEGSSLVKEWSWEANSKVINCFLFSIDKSASLIIGSNGR